MTERADIAYGEGSIKLAPGVRIFAQLSFGEDPQRKISVERTTHQDGLILRIPLTDTERTSSCRIAIKKETALQLAALLKEFGES